MKRTIKLMSILALAVTLATHPVIAQDSNRTSITTRTDDTGNREDRDDHGKWGLAGLLGLLGLLGLRKKDHHVEIHKNPNPGNRV